MLTQTQTLQRTAGQPSRVHDYLYDPNFIVSGERDHARSSMVAQASNSRIKCLPIFKTMFSDLRHHQRLELRLDPNNPVPKFISCQWQGQGHQDQTQDNAVTKFMSASFRPSQRSEDPQISGANRYKYFRRPQIPFSQSLGPEVILASARQDALSARVSSVRHREATPAQKTVQTQTDYRESEVQTDPYSPDYVVKPGTQPELLTLALLSHGCGLPAGLAEVEMIERARAKRAWEASLPPLSDMSQLEKRRRMMEEQERKEWALREKEIDKLQEARLKVLIKLLKEKEEQTEDLNTKRLDRVWARKQLEKKERVTKIRNEFMRAVRKLTAKKGKVEGKLERRNIITDYSSFGSQAFAPLTRIGVFIDRLADQYIVKNKYLTTYEGLLELENSLPDFMLQPMIRAPKRQLTTATGFVRRKYREEMELEEIHRTLKDKQAKALQPPKPLKFLQKVEKPVPRPRTPSVDVPNERNEEQELATIFLQKVLRGRSVQNMMYEGKEKRLELIQELRSTHALQAAGKQALNLEKMAVLYLQKQQQLKEQKESVVDETWGMLEGENLGDALDFLSKELVRLQEERRIHAFSMLAERQRRLREAKESGLRQVEERRRREEDEIFKQLVKVHQDSVDTYLEDIILAALNKEADKQARAEIHTIADQINDAAYEAEERRTRLDSEEIVAELVHGFLLPEVQKQYMREKVQGQQRKYIVAAHKEIREMSHNSCKDVTFRSDNLQGTGSRSQSRLEEKEGKASVDSLERSDQGSRQSSQVLQKGSIEKDQGAVKASQDAISSRLKSPGRPQIGLDAGRSSAGSIVDSRPSSRKSVAGEKSRKDGGRRESVGRRGSRPTSRPDSASSRKSDASQKRLQ